MLEKSGTWISYKGERLGQGRDNARVFLKENTEIRDKIDHELRKALGLVAHAHAPAADDNGKLSPDGQKPVAKAAAAGQARK